MDKKIIYLFATIGGAIGSYLPVWLFHVDGLSGWSILGGLVGGLAGIYAAYKIG